MKALTIAPQTMTSMEIAEVTGKQHSHILRDIKDEIQKLQEAGIDTQSKFGLSERRDSTGRKIPYYELTKEGVLQLAARYDAVVRAKLIELVMKKEQAKLSSKSETKLTFAEKQKEIEARYNNSLARKANVLLKIAANPDINPRYRQVLQAQASAIIAGKPLLPLPELEQKTYSAEEIGKMLGISANAVGRLAKQYNLKTDQYGKWYHDKSKYSAKEVETFRYYENVIPVLQEVLAEMRGRWKQ